MIKPLPGWVLIEPLEEEETVGGIKLPDSTQDFPMKGKVIELGVGSLVDPEGWHSSEDYREFVISRELQKESIIYFKKFSGQDIKHEGKEYKLVEFKDLLAIVE